MNDYLRTCSTCNETKDWKHFIPRGEKHKYTCRDCWRIIVAQEHEVLPSLSPIKRRTFEDKWNALLAYVDRKGS